MPNNASPSYEQIFYLGGGDTASRTGVSGIRSISAGYSVGQKKVRALGAGFIREVIAEPLGGSHRNHDQAALILKNSIISKSS